MSTKDESATALATNPYQAGRQEWMERYGSYIAQARAWRLIAVMALVVAGVAIGGLVAVIREHRVVPYVVKVDKLGGAIAVDRADAAERPDAAVITAQLARWITAVRTVYVDAAAQRSIVREAYAMVNRLGEAYPLLNEHMRANDPFQRAKTETVAIEVQSVLPISGDSWRIEWREDVRAREGTRVSTTQYQATANLSFNPPTDEETLRMNPSGLYINAFHWARRL